MWREEIYARSYRDDVGVPSARCLSEVKCCEPNLALAELDLSTLVYNQIY